MLLDICCNLCAWAVTTMIPSLLFYCLFYLCHCKQMKSSDIDQELFTETYCKVCSAQLISESQRVAHYEVRIAALNADNNLEVCRVSGL